MNLNLLMLADLGNTVKDVANNTKGQINNAADAIFFVVILGGLVISAFNKKLGVGIAISSGVIYVIYLVFFNGGIELLKSFV